MHSSGMKKALITGITGQDGALLAALLLEKSYEVHGVVRRASLPNTARIDAFKERLHLHYGDVTDAAAMMALVLKIQPDEIYNLAAQSDVHASFTMPAYTMQTNGMGTLSLLEGMRALPNAASCRFYQASTSELFGNSDAVTQNERTPFAPCSPYGASKLYAYWVVSNYRSAYGLFAANGILFNHESPLRGEMFASRKITKAVAAWSRGGGQTLKLGNLDAKRDWGHARDYVEGMWRILQQAAADDYVLATGESYSIRQFVERAFTCIGRDIKWHGEGLQEQGRDAKSGEILVAIDPALLRPVDVGAFCGDAAKARKMLGWQPRVSFDDMVREMVDADTAHG